MVWFAPIMFVVGALATWAILDAIYISPLNAQIAEMDLQNLKRELRAEADHHRQRAYIRGQRLHLGTPYIPREWVDPLVDTGDHSKSAELRVIQ